jgi:demethylmenaquinone methyltransferase / 2-methoxy-6-polyprenyl-1,4-benzoquinol methylase
MARLRAVTPGSPAELPTGDEKTARVRAMFDAIAPRYDLVNRLMTFGLDQRWRRRTVAALGLPQGSVVLDLACGTGDLSRAALAGGLRVIGADLSRGMLEANGTGTPLLQVDGAGLPLAEGSVDGVLCGYALRNLTDLPGSLSEMARVLRPGGRLAVLEVGDPPPGLVRSGYRLWFEHAVPVLGGLLSDADAYRYLPRSTAYLPDEVGLRTMFADAGFSTVGRQLLTGGLSQLLTGTRRGLPPRLPAP